jgi:hypothetical protein
VGTGDGSGNDYVNVVADGMIITNGDGSHGIYIDGTNGDVNISAEGSIITSGAASRGIFVYDTIGNVNVAASGTIATGTDYLGTPAASSFSYGIWVTNTDGFVLATLAETGSIETYGANGRGIGVFSTGDFNGTDYVNVIADGTVTTHGNYSYGIYVGQTNGNVTVSGTGSIIANGNHSYGIYVSETTGKPTLSTRGCWQGKACLLLPIGMMKSPGPALYVQRLCRNQGTKPSK